MSKSARIKQELGLYARRVCSAIFLSKRSRNEAIRNCGPPSKVEGVVFRVSYRRKLVSATFEGETRTAKFVGDQGSVVLPKGSDDISFTPVAITSKLPPGDQQEWPMGDVIPPTVQAAGIDLKLVAEAIRLAFDDPRNLTTAVVVIYKGRLVGEHYGPGVTAYTPLESWSMGKSLLAALFALLVADGTYTLNQRVPVPEWQGRRDPRRKLRIRDLLQMSSNLAFSTAHDPKYSLKQGYSDHMLGYCEGINVYEFAKSKRSKSSRIKYKGRYRNSDPWLLGWLLKVALLRRGEDYLTFPQRALFDRIGIREQVIETDPFGNLIFSGCDFGTARNWARFGLLHLQKGMWNGEQILPQGWTEFVSKPAPKWKNKVYGGLFWLNTDEAFPMLPRDTYYAAGGGGQFTFIIPKHDLVVVRMGHAKEFTAAVSVPESRRKRIGPAGSTKRMLQKLMEALSRE